MRVVTLLLIGCFLVLSCDLDPFNLATRPIAGGYELRKWEDEKTYLVVSRREGVDRGGVFGGDVINIGWSRDVILAERIDQSGGTRDWMLLHVQKNEVEGPFLATRAAAIAKQYRLVVMTSAEAWDRLARQ